ncbi:MAG: NAD-dependent epimerase/dehydratase family protein [Gammaproteobacteria bacterium]
MRMTAATAGAPILVTGATGFIGRRLVARLREHDFEVRALVLPGESPPAEWDSSVCIVHGDISDRQAVNYAVDGVAGVVHLAAVVGDWGPESLFQRVTVDGTQFVFKAALQRHIPVVLASSIVVYGDRLGRQVCDENTPHGRPLGPYGRAKQAQETIARNLVDRECADIRVVRPGNVYGPGSGPWVNEAAKILLSGSPALIDGGRQNAGLAYVDNVADVLFRALVEDSARGETFNACDADSVTWADYFSDLAEIVGAAAPKSVPRFIAWPLVTAMEVTWRLLRISDRPALTREALNLISSDHKVPNKKAKGLLGHRSLIDYTQGMSEVASSLDQSR